MRTNLGRVFKWDKHRQRAQMISQDCVSKSHGFEWQYRSHRRQQSVALHSQEVKEMVIAINIMLGVKVKKLRQWQGTQPQGDQMFLMWGMGTLSLQVHRHPFKWKLGEVVGTSNLPPKKAQQCGWEPGMLVNTGKLAAESRYHNPDPLICLLGHANETKVVVEEVEMMALVDTGSQISVLTEGIFTEMGLKILPLKNLIRGVLDLKGMGGISIPYKGYIEANLTIPDLPWYNESVLYLLVSNH